MAIITEDRYNELSFRLAKVRKKVEKVNGVRIFDESTENDEFNSMKQTKAKPAKIKKKFTEKDIDKAVDDSLIGLSKERQDEELRRKIGKIKKKTKEVDADEENERNREINFSRTQRSIETGGT